MSLFPLSFKHIDYLGCEDCPIYRSQKADNPVCDTSNMKEGCKKLLAGLEKV